MNVSPGQTVFHHVEVRPFGNQTATCRYITYFMGRGLHNYIVKKSTCKNVNLEKERKML